MRSLHILYIHQHFKTPAESGGTRSWEFIRRLAQDGRFVAVLSGGHAPTVAPATPPNIEVQYLGSPYKNSLGTIGRMKAFLTFALRSSVTSLRMSPDVVFATSTPLTVAIPALAAKTFRNIPFVFEVRDVWPLVPVQLGYVRNPLLIGIANILEKVAYDSADAVIALSPLMASDVSMRTDTPTLVIPNGSDIDQFRLSETARQEKRLALGWHCPTVIYTGSFGKIYNPLWMVDLAQGLLARGVNSVAYGEGALLEECREMASARNMAARTIFPGPISKTQVAHVTAAADCAFSCVLNHPALYPASINKIFDAFAAGVPVVTNHDGWLTDMIIAHRAGFKVASDPDEAASQVAELLGQPRLLQQMSENAARLGYCEFNRDKQYRDFSSTLVKVASGESVG